ncbi:hypothetical protein E4U36_007013 [Claviceps purpurea]|nr:hypothetical protein E4U36_007013 [Claviceps purpurea]
MVFSCLQWLISDKCCSVIVQRLPVQAVQARRFSRVLCIDGAHTATSVSRPESVGSALSAQPSTFASIAFDQRNARSALAGIWRIPDHSGCWHIRDIQAEMLHEFDQPPSDDKLLPSEMQPSPFDEQPPSPHVEPHVKPPSPHETSSDCRADHLRADQQ